jgi:hypothetical protein
MLVAVELAEQSPPLVLGAKPVLFLLLFKE